MNSLPLVAIIGMAVLVTATVGFGASLANTPEFNLIGASNDNTVGTARGNVTALVWSEIVGTDGLIETDSITFDVGNVDNAAAHSFDVCAVLEYNDGAQKFMPAAGAAPNCSGATSSLAVDAEESATITWTTPVDVDEIVDISFTIEELS